MSQVLVLVLASLVLVLVLVLVGLVLVLVLACAVLVNITGDLCGIFVLLKCMEAESHTLTIICSTRKYFSCYI